MSIKIPIDVIIDRIKEVHGDIVILDTSTYSNTHTKARFIDKELGEWWAIPKNVYRLKNGHPGKRTQKISISKTLSINDVKNKLQLKHNDEVLIDENTYINMTTKCKFVDKKYGEWWALPYTVINDGCRHPHATNEIKKRNSIRKYGVESPNQNREIALKQAKTQNKMFIRCHWKTDEELVCQGSWESKVIDYLNKNQIDFEWQPKVFVLPNGKTYRPDLFLINENKWIEIKGYFYKDALKKWIWFKSQFPSAELWNKEKLKEIGIL